MDSSDNLDENIRISLSKDTGTSEKSEWKALAESRPRVDKNFVWRLINSSAAFRIQEENAYLIEKGRAILKPLRK